MANDFSEEYCCSRDPFISDAYLDKSAQMTDFATFFADLPSPAISPDESLFDFDDELIAEKKKMPFIGGNQAPIRKWVMMEEDREELMMTGTQKSTAVSYSVASTGEKIDLHSTNSLPDPGGGPVRRHRSSTSRSHISHSKQAQYAREYRMKNKEHIEDLQVQVSTLRKANRELTDDKKSLCKRMSDLKAEVQYLRNVLVNESSLAGLISNATNRPGHKLQFTANRSGMDVEQNSGAGVCMHLQNDCLSIELCGRCNRQARSVVSQEDLAV